MSETNKKTIKWGIIGVGDVCEVKSGPALQNVEGSALTRFCHEVCLHVVVNFLLRYHTTSCMQTRIWNRDVVRVRCEDWDSDPINLFRVPFDTPNPKPKTPLY